jgi:hypothetical protein
MEKARLSAPGMPPLLLCLPDRQNLWEPVETVLASVTAPMARPSHGVVSLVLVSSSDRLALLPAATGGDDDSRLQYPFISLPCLVGSGVWLAGKFCLELLRFVGLHMGELVKTRVSAQQDKAAVERGGSIQDLARKKLILLLSSGAM